MIDLYKLVEGLSSDDYYIGSIHSDKPVSINQSIDQDVTFIAEVIRISSEFRHYTYGMAGITDGGILKLVVHGEDEINARKMIDHFLSTGQLVDKHQYIPSYVNDAGASLANQIVSVSNTLNSLRRRLDQVKFKHEPLFIDEFFTKATYASNEMVWITDNLIVKIPLDWSDVFVTNAGGGVLRLDLGRLLDKYCQAIVDKDPKTLLNIIRRTVV